MAETLLKQSILFKPLLRFPGFKNELGKKPFNELVKNIKINFNPSTSNEDFPCIELDCISQGTGRLLNTYSSLKLKSTKRRFRKEQVLFGKLRPYLKKFLQPNFDGVCSSEIWVMDGILLKNNYLFYLIQTSKFNREVNLTSGSKMPRANWSQIADVNFHFPSEKEQQKIASFLSSVDKRINLLERKKAKLEEYKKGVMQQIFNREIRFKHESGNKFREWKEEKFRDFLIEKSKKSKVQNEYSILSSTKNGVYLQSEYFTRDIASSNNIGYKILKKDQLVFSPQNVWMGNINVNLNYEIGLVSPSYKIFDFAKGYNPVYFKYFLKQPKLIFEYYRCSEQGASIVRKNLNMTLFKNINVKIPCFQEQNKIAAFLTTIDKKIELVDKQIEGTNHFKKGLLQQMFV